MRYISNYCKQELENQRIVRLAADDRLAKNVVRRQKLRMQFKEAKEAKQAREMYEAAMTAAAAEEAKRCVAEQVAVEAERVQLAALAAAEENAWALPARVITSLAPNSLRRIDNGRTRGRRGPRA